MSGGNQLEKGNQQADRRRKARAGQQKEQTVGGASLWQNQSPPVASRPALKGERRTETAVIGGGMAGVLTAWLLKEAGKKVILLEAAELASGQTGKTTAKITSQHGLIYDRLLTGAGGRPLAQAYASANQEAIGAYQKIIEAKGIDCGFQRLPAYLYTREKPEVLRAEAAAAAELGLAAAFTLETELPFPVAGALRFEDQACFQPLDFLRALAGELEIYEHTPVLRVETAEEIAEDAGVLADAAEGAAGLAADSFVDSREEAAAGKGRLSRLSAPGGTVLAESVVFATHYPFINMPGYFFPRLSQERSYALALEGTPALSGMYYGIDPDGYSFRPAGNYLLFGGGSHRTGENQEGGRYAGLAAAASEIFPGSRAAFAWSAQDCVTPDGVPYAGRYSADRPGWYVATGFNKWGMTGSMVAAQLVSDLILGRENPWAAAFSPQASGRLLLAQAGKTLLSDGLKAAAALGRRFLPAGRRVSELAELARGQAIIIDLPDEEEREEEGRLETVPPQEGPRGSGPPEYSAPERGTLGAGARESKRAVAPAQSAAAQEPPLRGKLGVYRDRAGQLHGVVPVCPHMGCQLTFNPDEESWDCPCHGSRFTYTGQLIDNPAREGLRHEILLWSE